MSNASFTKLLREFIRRNPVLGRYVEANRKISQGEVLFLEKAYITCPKYDESPQTKLCYHCMEHIENLIPCKLCSVYVYCGIKCRDEAFQEYHEHECAGIRTNFFVDFEALQMPLRALIKGIPSKFASLTDEQKENVHIFGNESDNYPYFNELCSNLSKRNDSQHVSRCALLLAYVVKKTNLFHEISEVLSEPDLFNFVGGKLLKHLQQSLCNRGLVAHWQRESADNVLPEFLFGHFQGIFMSSSMLNHSCIPNTTIYFIKDVIVVKALKNIKKGEQVLCNYLPKEKLHTTEERKKNLQYYCIDCKCAMCTGSTLSTELINAYRCQSCSGPLIEENPLMICRNCGDVLPSFFNTIASMQIERIYGGIHGLKTLQSLTSCYVNLQKMYCKNHLIFLRLYLKFCDYHLNKGQLDHAFTYFKKCQEVLSVNFGEFSHFHALNLFGFINTVLGAFVARRINPDRCRRDLQKLRNMYAECKKIIYLHMHEDEIDFRSVDRLFRQR